MVKFETKMGFNNEIISMPYTYILNTMRNDMGEELTPKRMKLKGDIVIIDFKELGIRHELARTNTVELFYRDKPKKNVKTENNT